MSAFDEPFSLQRRNLSGNTQRLANWGFANETDRLTDVLLGSPAYLMHRATSSLSRKHLRENPCNIQVAQAQHKELVSAYEHFGVRIHWHEPSPELTMQVYSRDSSVMTPYGAIITAMAQWWRRGENYAAIRTYEKLGIPIYDMVTAGTFEGGDFNVIEDGPYDGVSELWFDTRQAFEAAYATPHGKSVAADTLAMVDQRVRMIVSENVIVGEA